MYVRNILLIFATKIKTMKTKFNYLAYLVMLISTTITAQNVGINSTGSAPNNSAGLDVDFTNKGLLIPRIALTSATDAATIPSPAPSLLVYNTGSGGLSPAGYYYNAGTSASPNWVPLLSGGSPEMAWLLSGNAGTDPASHFLGTTNNVDLVFRTNNTERMRITANGDVAIGTTAQGAKLHVKAGYAGYVRIDSENDNILLIGHDTNLGDWIEFRPENALGLAFLKGPDAHAMVVTNTGNVGIGTTTPLARLHVTGEVYSTNGYGDIVYIGGDNAGDDAEVGIQSASRNKIRFFNRTQAIQAICEAQSFVSTSDSSLKENIKPLTYGINQVMQLKPVAFNYKRGDNHRTRVGFIAQDVLRIIPEVIDESNGILYMRYNDITAILTKAIQEQQQVINQLQSENQLLKQQLEQQKQKNEEFSVKLEKLEQHIGILEAKKLD